MEMPNSSFQYHNHPPLMCHYLVVTPKKPLPPGSGQLLPSKSHAHFKANHMLISKHFVMVCWTPPQAEAVTCGSATGRSCSPSLFCCSLKETSSLKHLLNSRTGLFPRFQSANPLCSVTPWVSVYCRADSGKGFPQPQLLWVCDPRRGLELLQKCSCNSKLKP